MRRLRLSVFVRRATLIAGAAMLVAGCGKQGEAYQRPPAEVRDLLRTVEVPLYMFGSSAETDALVDGSDPSAISWKIVADDSPLMTFTARMKPEGDTGTRVTVDVEGARAGKYGDVQARLEKAREIRALYLVSMTEAVDSTLDGRAYDITRTYPALITAGAANAALMFAPAAKTSSPATDLNQR